MHPEIVSTIADVVAAAMAILTWLAARKTGRHPPVPGAIEGDGPCVGSSSPREPHRPNGSGTS